MINLIVNNGSSSKKYALYKGEDFIFSVHYERVIDRFVKTEKTVDGEKETDIDLKIFEGAFCDMILGLIKKGLIKTEEDISRIGLRIVAPGNFFQEHHFVDVKFMEALDEKYHLSPLHIKPVQDEIAEILDKMPKVDMYAISDSAFHKDKPDYSNIYTYPKDLARELELYRFGYHGLSVSSIVEKLQSENKLPEKMIVCHLGGGSSLTAVKNGQSLDNSMGYSPLEGVPMATRVGNADPNSLFAIMDNKDFDISEAQEFLYKECGFKGISDVSGDTRAVLKAEQGGNNDAKLALDFYAYEIKKLIGSYKLILGGLDALIFTGTIGNRSADVRKRICKGLDSEGIIIDDSKNKLMINNEGSIQSQDSQADILVIKTDEMGKMNQILNTF